MHLVVYLAGVPLLQLADEGVALEQGIALLVNLKLLKTQVGDAVGHILQLVGGGQRLLLLVEDARQQQAPFQHRDLLFDIALGLQGAIEPVLNFDILLNQRVAFFRGVDQPLAELVVEIQLLFHQRISLDTRGLIRRNGLLGGFFRQRQALVVDRLLQELELMLQTVAVGRHIVALFLQGILQGGVALKAFTLLIYLGIQQCLLGQQQRLLGRTQRPLPRPGAVQAVTYLLKLLRGRVHSILYSFRLSLQRHQLAIVGGQIVLRSLEIVQQL